MSSIARPEIPPPQTRSRPRPVMSIAVGTGIVFLIAAAVLAGRPPEQSMLFPSAPAEACRLPETAGKGETDLPAAWHLVVEAERTEGRAMLFVSNSDTLLCRVSRSPDGSLGPVIMGQGRLSPNTQANLTLESGMGTAGKLDIFVGRAPPMTETVRITADDGTSDTVTSVANGFYLAWLPVPGRPVRIEALDANAQLLGRIEDPEGISIPR